MSQFEGDKIIFGSRIIKINYIEPEVADKKKIFGEFCSNKNILTIDKSLDPIEDVQYYNSRGFSFDC